MEADHNGVARAVRTAAGRFSRRSLIALAALALLGACKPDMEKVEKGPQPDLAVAPGLSVFFESDQTVHFTIVAVDASGKVSPLFEGKGRPGELKATPVNHPGGSQVRLRFVPAGMPRRGEEMTYFRAAEGRFTEIPKSADIAEILYKDGIQSYGITCEGRKALAKPRQ